MSLILFSNCLKTGRLECTSGSLKSMHRENGEIVAVKIINAIQSEHIFAVEKEIKLEIIKVA